MDYKQKYLKYRQKYLNLKAQMAGADLIPVEPVLLMSENLDFFLNYNTKADTILRKYQNFKNKSLIQGPISRLGEPSANGFITSLVFKNSEDDKRFHAILKTTREKTADNNYFEFFVGKCINVFKQYYPNFVYSFGYLNLQNDLKKELEENETFTNMSKFTLKSEILDINNTNIYDIKNIGTGCLRNDRSSVLIENVPNDLSTKKLLVDPLFNRNIDYNATCILLQIYALLAGLKSMYTHYDLHTGNIMYIKLPRRMKIIYNIPSIGESFTLFTNFIPVIIDYGRSFINCTNYNTNILSSAFTEFACENPNCNNENHPTCNLNGVGMAVNRDKDNNYTNQDNFYFINLRKYNPSSDLRFILLFMYSLANLKESDGTLKPVQLANEFLTIFNSSNNPEWISGNSLSPNVNSMPDSLISNGTIKTTTDAFIWLLKYYKTNYPNMETFSPTIFGTINITEGKKWVFTKS